MTSVVLPEPSGGSTEWALRIPSGEERAVFTTPCDARVLGSLQSDFCLMTIVSTIYGQLMLGRVGDTLVEVAACWAFVLLITGVYLWWPRQAGLLGTLVPRLSLKGRPLWRDLHAVPAFWNAIFVGFLILSGLPWAGFWGEQLAKLGTVSHMTTPSPNFSAPPSLAALGAEPAGGHAHHDDTTIPWAVRHATVPYASGTAGNGIKLPRVMQVARQQDLMKPGLKIDFPLDQTQLWRLSWVPDRAQEQRTLYVHPRDGQVMQDLSFDKYSALGKAVEFGVMTHVGRQFGLINQLICVLVCLLTVLIAVTGLVMWWQRRPRGKLGAPELPPAFRIPATVTAITLICAVIFPLLGASLLIVLLLDYLVIARIQRLRYAFGN